MEFNCRSLKANENQSFVWLIGYFSGYFGGQKQVQCKTRRSNQTARTARIFVDTRVCVC